MRRRAVTKCKSKPEKQPRSIRGRRADARPGGGARAADCPGGEVLQARPGADRQAWRRLGASFGPIWDCIKKNLDRGEIP
jgi:hypothetical protein